MGSKSEDGEGAGGLRRNEKAWNNYPGEWEGEWPGEMQYDGSFKNLLSDCWFKGKSAIVAGLCFVASLVQVLPLSS